MHDEESQNEMEEHALPVGKLPPDMLARLLASAPLDDADVVVGPGVGLDCAVVEHGERLLVLKSDPITFATDELGWYLVQINANDVATSGARPRWMLVTLLLPQGKTTEAGVEALGEQIYATCRRLGIAVVGGHTEVTHGLSRPIAVGTLVGDVAPENLVTAQGAAPGDHILLTKGVPIEGTAILAREFAEALVGVLSAEELEEAAGFLYDPGISVLRDAQVAVAAGRVTAMHDPTEGGLAAALWELSEACGHALFIDRQAVPIPRLSAMICSQLSLDPLATIASGALLLAVAAEDASGICSALVDTGIACAHIGEILEEPPGVWQLSEEGRRAVAWPERDEIARLYETRDSS